MILFAQSQDECIDDICAKQLAVSNIQSRILSNYQIKLLKTINKDSPFLLSEMYDYIY